MNLCNDMLKHPKLNHVTKKRIEFVINKLDYPYNHKMIEYHLIQIRRAYDALGPCKDFDGEVEYVYNYHYPSHPKVEAVI